MAPINTNNVLIRLQEQSVRECSFLEASFVDYVEVARLNEERVDDVANPILEKFVNDLGPEDRGGGLTGWALCCNVRRTSWVHDLTILHTRRDLHTTNLTKSACEAALPDHGELLAKYMATWACLVDMGYIGVDHTLRGIHPKRRPQNGTLDAADVERNRRLSSDRVVVENFFGRVCSFIQRTTFALTNFHLSLMPARTEDEDYYALVMARYQGMANERKRKRAESQPAIA
ncbi:hypothetical protein H257_07189 [Aphanomyces astaci]|uniref:DDE Tnp4 domain-containing protein n=1 Tax=Aphanomyces astaci TaxID=112090 RepID=W4GKW7_APHAT|nr:hypothetical protein H257_07189 [Aphanomyces astaci]ETV79996.1 hypothetical protein H257_07189 [Aphanomyces astaci]|eukprot:XP_009830932.1 hypothetical protein H257_07189 [Aphanomyces astaci]